MIETIHASLEAVAERHGDPTEAVYTKMFAEHPDMKPLFILDEDGGAQGHMLQEAIDMLIDMAGENRFGENFIQIELANHVGFGVPTDVFMTFFRIIKDTFKELLGADWSNAFETAWDELLTHADAIMKAKVAEAN